ncbi:MAG: hypothetical protein WCG76_09380 [Verrucomicrobiota bacterium]
MIGYHPCGRRPCPTRPGLRAKLPAVLLALVLSAIAAPRGFATGYYGPSVYLGEGGTRVFGTPEFYWDLEVKRLARQFHPTEKFLPVTEAVDRAESYVADAQSGDAERPWMKARKKATGDADLKGFADALKDGRIKPPDQAKATQQHADARAFLSSARGDNAGPLPEEFDSEFADYHKGALAYLRGKGHWDEARQAWESLLKRPDSERHFRSVWAAFMLGKMALKSGSSDAVKWFQTTRELAKDGFADSLGMAADSYGWEGRSEYKQDHPEKAARLFLTQLAAGDESAVVSLKALIPDRVPVEGMLNYGPEDADPANMTDEQKRAEDDTLPALRRAAADPLLRRLVTAHILSTATADGYFDEQSRKAARQRGERWVNVVNEAKPGKVEDAEYLGWVAYNNGAYKEASRWLKMADAQAPAACWLRAKLQLREGQTHDAAKSLSAALVAIRAPAQYTGWKPASSGEENSFFTGWGGTWTLGQRAGGELAQVRLALNDFIQALDTFLSARLWEDAAYVAERVLTSDELKAYVDKLPASSGTTENPEEDPTPKLRFLLGRKLVRENRTAEAKAYLRSPYDKVLEKYVAALQEAKNEKLPKSDRAKALFAAAWIARYDGMELMGTEVAPDGFVSEGCFESAEIAKPRLTGKYKKMNDSADPPRVVVSELPLKATGEEKRRIQSNRIEPDTRFHYRYLAAEMAMNAAKLMPDNTEELTDVINTAGGWVKDRDEKKGNQYYQALETRCAGTALGRQAIAKRWFVDAPGPWSTEQKAARTALHEELSIPSE